jgi:heptosyltransferase I
MQSAPHSICLLRLSALGDVTHVLPVVHTLRRAWPDVTITWIIGKAERRLLEDLLGVEFIVFDKRAGFAGITALRRQLAGRRFDALLQMQLALRANLLSSLIHADMRIGYDRARSKELHGLLVNRRIPAGGQHVLDVLGRFVEPLGLHQDRVEWHLSIPEEAHAWATRQLPGTQPTLLISPCSSHALRNWRPERYAAVADHAAQHGYRIVLCGGRSAPERKTADAILASMHASAIDLTGKDTLKQLAALLQRADLLLSPDAGPVHIANALGRKVLGLYACTDATRSGPYSDLRYTINRYDDAARTVYDKPASTLRWGKRIEVPGVMDLIGVEEVLERFERFDEDRRGGTLYVAGSYPAEPGGAAPDA